MFDVSAFAAIITPPQVAILATARPVERWVVRDGEPRQTAVMTATLSADHRAVDGVDAARFLETFKSAIGESRDAPARDDRATRGGDRDNERTTPAHAGELDRVAWLRQMVEIRLFEDKVQELFMQGRSRERRTSARGRKPSPSAPSARSRTSDYLTITYRGHGHALARGMSMEAAFGELMGLTSGCCRGVGGSMHLTDFSRNLIGAFAIIGAGFSVAVGAALSAKMRGSDAVALAFCGDGATNIGTFHEALNMAVGLEGAGRVRDREQPVRRVQPAAGDDTARRPRRAGEGARDARSDRRRPGRERRLRDGRDGRVPAPGPATARRSSRRRPTATAATREPTRPSTAPKASSSAGRSATRSTSSAPCWRPKDCWARTSSVGCAPRFRTRSMRAPSAPPRPRPRLSRRSRRTSTRPDAYGTDRRAGTNRDHRLRLVGDGGAHADDRRESGRRLRRRG